MKPDKPTQADYVRTKNFRDNLRKSPTLTSAQKQAIFRMALQGDMDRAEKEYKKLVTIQS